MPKSRKWIQDATSASTKGALHRALGVPVGERIPDDKLEAAAKQPGKTGQRARFALTVRKFANKRRNERKVAHHTTSHAHVDEHVVHERTQKLSEHEKTIEIAQKYSKEPPARIKMLVDILYSTSRKLRHYAELELSVRPLSPRENQDEQERWGTVKKIAQKLGATKAVHGDVRGYYVKVVWPGGESNDWGSEEWGID